MRYSVQYLPSAVKDIRKLPATVLRTSRKSIDALKETPFPKGSTKIRGYEHFYGIRIGRYRIVYEVAKTIRIITIIRIGHRKDVYKKL